MCDLCARANVWCLCECSVTMYILLCVQTYTYMCLKKWDLCQSVNISVNSGDAETGNILLDR